MNRNFFVYIIASGYNGTLYIGVTNDLERRIMEHKSGLIPGFSSKYQVYNLVYYEQFPDARSAIDQEKKMKKWNREWKINLIEKENPDWEDLAREYNEINTTMVDSRLRGNDGLNNKDSTATQDSRLRGNDGLND